MSIPKLLWITVEDKDNLHPELLNNIDNITSLNHNYKLKIVDNEDFIKILQSKKPEWLNYFNKLNKNFGALIGDYIRYCLLYLYGGVYVDCKTLIKEPFDTMYNENDNCVFFEWKTSNIDEYCNYFLISKPNQNVYKKIIDQLNNKIINYNKADYDIKNSRLNVLKFSGPHFIKDIIDSEYNSVTIKNNNERTKNTRHYFTKGYKKFYLKPHYVKVKEHLVLMID